MKKVLLLLIAIPNVLFGQFNSDNELYNNMANLKQNVTSIIEERYKEDKKGKAAAKPSFRKIFSFNKNNQIESVQNIDININPRLNSTLMSSFTFEEVSPWFIKQETIEGDFNHQKNNYSYTISNNTTGSTIFKNYAKNGKPFREFILDKNKNITAVYEHNGRQSRDYTGILFEYNSKGYVVKETDLANEEPREITTYTLNENGDIIEKLEFDVKSNKYDFKYEYSYTYDKNNN